MRGLMIQLKGANRGARAERYKQLIGCTEIQSENMRMFRMCKTNVAFQGRYFWDKNDGSLWKYKRVCQQES